MGKRYQKHRRIQAAAFLVAGSLIAAPAVAAILDPGATPTPNNHLVQVALAISATAPQAADSGLDARWQIASDGIREVSLGFPSKAATVPFNLFASPDLIPGYEHLGKVPGAGEDPIIVPGDQGHTTLRVTNAGPLPGVLTLKFENNELKPNTNPVAYRHLLINGQPAADLLKYDTTPLSTEVMPELAKLQDGQGRILLNPGQQIDLPFSWSFYADPAERLANNNVGNFEELAASFQLNLSLATEVTQLTILKALEGPTAGVFADLEHVTSGWDMEVFAVGHQHDEAGLTPSETFSGLYQTSAMAVGRHVDLLVDPYLPDGQTPALYTAVLETVGSPEFVLYQDDPNDPIHGKNRAEIAGEFDNGGALQTALLSPVERDVFGQSVGSLQCILLGPFDESTGQRPQKPVDDGTGIWATGPYGGRNGYVSIPAGHHAVCEKVSRTSAVQVEKRVTTYDASGREIASDVLPSEWRINITPVGGTADLTATTNALTTAPQAVGPTQALSGDVRVRPGQAYRIDLVAPAERLDQGYELVDVYLTSRPVGEPARQYVVGHDLPDTVNSANDNFASGRNLAETTRAFSLLNAPLAGEPTWGADFVPFGSTLADTPVRVPNPDGAVASWILTFEELTASTITFESNNWSVATSKPLLPDIRPGNIIPGKLINGTNIPTTVVGASPATSQPHSRWAAARARLARTGVEPITLLMTGVILVVGVSFVAVQRRRKSEQVAG